MNNIREKLVLHEIDKIETIRKEIKEKIEDNRTKLMKTYQHKPITTVKLIMQSILLQSISMRLDREQWYWKGILNI